MAAKRSATRDVDLDFFSVQENSGSNSNVPAFLMKLWTLVEDPSNNDIICWDMKGKSFHIFDQSRFAHEVLPLYFKHNNISSFIRQLNMYGFRKVVKVDQGGLKVERDDLEFQHMYFQRGQEQLLDMIKRKAAPIKAEPRTTNFNPDEVSKVLSDVTQIKGKQESIAATMTQLQRENSALWREVAQLRQKHAKQQQIVNKLLQFLVSLMNSHSRGMTSLQRKRPLMINHTPQLPDTSGIPPAKLPKLHLDDTDHAYTVQSPADLQRPSSVLSASGVVIRELLEPSETSTTVTAALPPNTSVSSTPSRTERPEAPTVSVAPSSSSSPSPAPAPTPPPSSTPSLLDQALMSANILPQTSQMSAMQSQPATVPVVTAGAQARQQQQQQQRRQETATKQIVLRGVTDKPLSATTTSPKEMTDQIELMQSDLDHMREVLSSGQYSLDPSILAGLFDPQSPFPVGLDQSFLDSLTTTDSDTSDQGTSSSPAGGITGQELWQYQPPEVLPDLFDDLDTDKPPEDDDGGIGIFYENENKDSNLNTPNIYQPSAPFASDGADLSITAEDLD